MTANVLVQQHSNSHHAALQYTAAHKQQQSSGSEALWFSRFISRKSRKSHKTPAPGPQAASPIPPTTEVTVELKDGAEQSTREKSVVNEHTLARQQSEGHLALAPTKPAAQTLTSKRSFNFMAHRKPSTSALSTKAAAAAEPHASSPQPHKKTAAYVPRHAASDFSQVAIPTTYRDSYASMYTSGSDRRSSSSTTPPPHEREVRRYASVGNMPSITAPKQGARGQRSMVFATEAEDIPEAGSLSAKCVSDGLQAPPKQPHTATRAQSTPDIRAAASAKGPSSSSRLYTKYQYQYRTQQQQHASQNTIFTVPEHDRESSTSMSMSMHRSGRAASTAGSMPSEPAVGMSSLGRKLSEYIKPAALSAKGKAAAAHHSMRPPPYYKAQGLE